MQYYSNKCLDKSCNPYSVYVLECFLRYNYNMLTLYQKDICHTNTKMKYKTDHYVQICHTS